VVDLDGVILSPKIIVEQLKKFADDDSVKAIVIHVNSPGGGVAASEEIYREVKRIRDEKKSESWLPSIRRCQRRVFTFHLLPTRFTLCPLQQFAVVHGLGNYANDPTMLPLVTRKSCW